VESAFDVLKALNTSLRDMFAAGQSRDVSVRGKEMREGNYLGSLSP